MQSGRCKVFTGLVRFSVSFLEHLRRLVTFKGLLREVYENNNTFVYKHQIVTQIQIKAFVLRLQNIYKSSSCVVVIPRSLSVVASADKSKCALSPPLLLVSVSNLGRNLRVRPLCSFLTGFCCSGL